MKNDLQSFCQQARFLYMENNFPATAKQSDQITVRFSMQMDVSDLLQELLEEGNDMEQIRVVHLLDKICEIAKEIHGISKYELDFTYEGQGYEIKSDDSPMPYGRLEEWANTTKISADWPGPLSEKNPDPRGSGFFFTQSLTLAKI